MYVFFRKTRKVCVLSHHRHSFKHVSRICLIDHFLSHGIKVNMLFNQNYFLQVHQDCFIICGSFRKRETKVCGSQIPMGEEGKHVCMVKFSLDQPTLWTNKSGLSSKLIFFCQIKIQFNFCQRLTFVRSAWAFILFIPATMANDL